MKSFLTCQGSHPPVAQAAIARRSGSGDYDPHADVTQRALATSPVLGGDYSPRTLLRLFKPAARGAACNKSVVLLESLQDLLGIVDPVHFKGSVIPNMPAKPPPDACCLSPHYRLCVVRSKYMRLVEASWFWRLSPKRCAVEISVT